MVLGLGSFMESYNSNIQIKDGGDLANIFEGVEPCTYEEAIETFFEAQYSVEAMAVLTENAVMMEAAGTVDVVNEGIVGSFVSAAWDKLKECATKVKQFAVACVKKVVQFFKELYNKATPIDKVMQMYGKKPVEYKDIQMALADGALKFGPKFKFLVKNPDDAIAILYGKFEYKGADIVNDIKTIGANDDANADMKIKATKENLLKQKEEDKQKFTWVGQLLSDDDEYSKKNQAEKFILTHDKENTISPEEWSAISDYALNGQAKQRTYRTEIEKTAKDAVKAINDAQKELDKSKQFDQSAAGEEHAAKLKANASKIAAAYVQYGTYMANRAVNVMSKVTIPVMRKMHATAVSDYIFITNRTKAFTKKREKKLK